ncbi:MAG: helix-turn-helix transcriptional regulator [Deltaproteobacteria bacterium]|nr:helix-turn-helix transcriptional regulator [Deltaproteobacteria bacterium]
MRLGAMPRRRDKKLLVAIGRRFQEVRRAHGWTQETLAEALDIEPVTLSRYERGHRALSLSTLALAAKTMGVGLAELLDTDLPPPKATRAPGEGQVLRFWTGMDEERRDLALRILREIARR